MVKTALTLVAFLSLQTTSSVGTPFQPWGAGSYQTVNAIEFAPDATKLTCDRSTANGELDTSDETMTLPGTAGTFRADR